MGIEEILIRENYMYYYEGKIYILKRVTFCIIK